MEVPTLPYNYGILTMKEFQVDKDGHLLESRRGFQFIYQVYKVLLLAALFYKQVEVILNHKLQAILHKSIVQST
jgi:hypothetical protein